MIAIDLSKQQALDSDPRAIQRIAFTGNLEQQATIFLIFKEAKQTVLVCSQGPIKVFQFYFFYNIRNDLIKQLNVKLSNSQLNNLKSAIKKYETEVTLNLSLNIVGDSNDENNFPKKLLITNT